MGNGGEIFILDMGEPVKIVDLARDLITLSGFRVGEDIEIQFTGVRPGEKLFEELSLADEQADKTRHAKIFVGRLAPYPWKRVEEQMTRLNELAHGGDEVSLRKQMSLAVPEFKLPGTSVPPKPRDEPSAHDEAPVMSERGALQQARRLPMGSALTSSRTGS